MSVLQGMPLSQIVIVRAVYVSLCVISFAVYRNTLSAQFTFDDNFAVVRRLS